MCMPAHSCPILCYPMDYSLVGSSDHGILQTRILGWVAIPFSGGFSPPRGQTRVSWVSWIGRKILSHWVTWEAITSSLNPFCRGKIGTHISLATSLGAFHTLLPSLGNVWPLSLACLLSFCLSSSFSLSLPTFCLFSLLPSPPPTMWEELIETGHWPWSQADQGLTPTQATWPWTGYLMLLSLRCLSWKQRQYGYWKVVIVSSGL